MKESKEEIKTQDLKESLVKNTFWSFAATLINRSGALIFTIILARVLMPEGFGLYSIALSVAMIFLTFSDLGVNQAVVRYISSALLKNKNQVPSYFRYLRKVKAILIITFTSAFIFLAYPLAVYVFKKPVLFLPFVFAAIYIAVLSFEGFHSQIFYSIEKVQYVSYRDAIGQIARIAFVLLVFYFVSEAYHLIGVFSSLALAYLLVLIFNLYVLRKEKPLIFHKKTVEIDKHRVNTFIFYLTLAAISTVFFSYIDAIMLGMFVPAEFVGYYKAAFSLILGIIGFVGFPIAIMLPYFTKLKKHRIEKLLNKVFKYIALISIPASIGLLFVGSFFIRLLYGPLYEPAATPLNFLAFLIFPTLAVYLFLSLFSGQEKPQLFAKLIFIALLINISLNLIFIKIFILTSYLQVTVGVGLATLISWSFYFIVAVYYIKKEFDIKVYFKPVIKALIASAIMIFVLKYVLSFIAGGTLSSVIIKMILGVLVYSTAIILMKGFGKEDLKLLKLLVKRKK